MAIEYYPYDDGDGAVVREDDWRDMARLWRNTGVIENKLNDFEVFADNTGMLVKVKSGWAWIEGHLVKSDAEEEVTIPAADGSNPRKDLIVLRNHFGNNEITLEVIEGTPATSPTAPSPTQNTTQWEIALAVVDVATSETSIENSHVTDQRSFSSGNQGPAEQIEETGGPTTLDIAAIADGEVLQRSGTDVIGRAPIEDLITAAGDLLYGSGVGAAARLALGTDGQILRAGNSAPEYYTPDVQQDYIGTSETTMSGTFTDLATVGPSITLAVGPLGIAIISLNMRLHNSTTAGVAGADISVDAGSPDSQDYLTNQNTNIVGCGMVKIFTGLSEGNHTFVAKYLTSSGTGTFSRRRITGLAL